MISQKEVKENLYTSLKEIGLSDQEIDLYVVSLALGPSPIKTIAEHMNISRPNVYKVIAELEKHGLTDFSVRKKYTRDFLVEPPTVVLEKLRKKKQLQDNIEYELSATMPDLLALYKQGDKVPGIRILQGRDQYKKTYQMILDEAKNEIQFFGSVADFVDFHSWEEQEKLIKARRKKNIRVQALVLQCAEAVELKKKDKEELRETRVLEGAKPFAPSFQLFANKIIIWQPKAPLAILIEDEYIVQMFKSMFAQLWEASK